MSDPHSMDPFGPWRSFRDANMEAWAKALTEAVNTEAFAQALGAYLDSYLATSAPFQKAIDQYMHTMLPRLSMPTRDEVIDLARRMTNIELRLDDLDAKTDQLLQAQRQPQATAAQDDSPELATWLQAIDDKMTRILLKLEQSGGPQRAKPAQTRTRSAETPAKPRRSRRAAAQPSQPAAEEQTEDRALEGLEDAIG